MVDNRERDRTRAVYKKGQKCIVPLPEVDEATGEETISYYPAQVRARRGPPGREERGAGLAARARASPAPPPPLPPPPPPPHALTPRSTS
jgi:hypothetical protein